MKLVFVSRTPGIKIPKKFLNQWGADVSHLLVKHKILSSAQKKLIKSQPELVLAFVSAVQMKKLNKQFRGKDYATDVLSFEGQGLSDDGVVVLGELVLCLPVIKLQAKEHGLSLNEELGYMVLHGILHLLGFDHEGTRAQAARMYKVQDEIFAKLR
jgi:probable rRNA maturation factor